MKARPNATMSARLPESTASIAIARDVAVVGDVGAGEGAAQRRKVERRNVARALRRALDDMDIGELAPGEFAATSAPNSAVGIGIRDVVGGARRRDADADAAGRQYVQHRIRRLPARSAVGSRSSRRRRRCACWCRRAGTGRSDNRWRHASRRRRSRRAARIAAACAIIGDDAGDLVDLQRARLGDRRRSRSR